jgi:hypothetical protein
MQLHLRCNDHVLNFYSNTIVVNMDGFFDLYTAWWTLNQQLHHPFCISAQDLLEILKRGLTSSGRRAVFLPHILCQPAPHRPVSSRAGRPDAFRGAETLGRGSETGLIPPDGRPDSGHRAPADMDGSSAQRQRARKGPEPACADGPALRPAESWADCPQGRQPPAGDVRGARSSCL